MKTVKLGPMRLKLSEASELVESSTRLPPMGEMGVASDFKLECGQESDITSFHRDVQTSKTIQVKKQCKLKQKSRRKGKAKASG
ncbi:hypothetical protein Goklo_012384 [Gossypium klotzschianum]|uniref:Uncharacterized protein n=1 Tax=Gossypium klotzschianum TaxID=34286 RepID=A0A7J8VD35_9ROSI|nr:hypothetical protein [Gossypium klotzschianum]